MDWNNCSNNGESAGEYIRWLEEKSNMANIPAVVMVVLFAVVGLVGNILVLVVYSQKVRLNPTKVLIMTIASFDLVANVGAIPTAITTMFDTWNFSRPGLCKLTVFLGSFTALGGAISLLIVAVIRYRKVCRPYGWQITIRQAIIASLTSFLLAFIFSIPYIIIYGIRTRQTPCPNIQGSDCFADDRYFSTVWPLLNNMLFIVIYLSLSVSMIVLYTFIGVTAWKHSRLHGISGVTTSKDSHDNSRSGLSSTIPIQTTSKAELSKHQPSTTHTSSHECLNPLFCCTKHQTREKTQENTPSSTAMKFYSTTSTDIEDSNSESINPQPTTDNKFELQLPSTLEGTLKQFNKTPDISNSNECHQLESNFPDSKPPRRQSRTSEDTRYDRDSSLLDDISIDGDIHPIPHPHINKSSQDSNLNISSGPKQPTSTPINHARKTKSRLPLGKMTAMLIIISAIFVLGFLPFLILTIYKNQLPEKYASLNQLEQVFYNLFYRLYFLNSAANPIVYSLCDVNFRRNCILLLTCRRSRS